MSSNNVNANSVNGTSCIPAGGVALGSSPTGWVGNGRDQISNPVDGGPPTASTALSLAPEEKGSEPNTGRVPSHSPVFQPMVEDSTAKDNCPMQQSFPHYALTNQCPNSDFTGLWDKAQPIINHNHSNSYNLNSLPDNNLSTSKTHFELDNDSATATTIPPPQVDSSNAQQNWTTVRGAPKKRGLHRGRNARGSYVKTFQNLFNNNEPYYEKFFTISFPGKNITENINVIQTEKDLLSTIGTLQKKVRATTNSLLVETVSASQTEKLRKVTMLGGNQVVVSPFKLHNTTKGILKSKALGQSSIAELLEAFSTQGVVNIRRMQRKEGAVLIDMDMYEVIFQTLSLPESLSLSDWFQIKVYPYKEKPQQCRNCQRFGHVLKFCRQTHPRCAKCGTGGHTFSNCDVQVPSCVNCSGQHFATDKTCPKYLLEEEILSVMVTDKTSKLQAREIVRARTPFSGRSFSSAVRQQPFQSSSASTPSALSHQLTTTTVTADVHRVDVPDTVRGSVEQNASPVIPNKRPSVFSRPVSTPQQIDEILPAPISQTLCSSSLLSIPDATERPSIVTAEDTNRSNSSNKSPQNKQSTSVDNKRLRSPKSGPVDYSSSDDDNPLTAGVSRDGQSKAPSSTSRGRPPPQKKSFLSSGKNISKSPIVRQKSSEGPSAKGAPHIKTNTTQITQSSSRYKIPVVGGNHRPSDPTVADGGRRRQTSR